MSIPILNQVYDETRRLAIAGSVVAGNDFRLKKLVPSLEKAGEKAPVFAKVAQAVNGVLNSTEATSAAALLDLSTLVNAILYTQGETGATGEWQPLESVNLGQQETQASARMLKPLIEALTSTGSGRLEIIRDAVERRGFRDLRLIKPALQAIDDTYGEIADLVANQVLPMYGKAIYPELQQKFDVKGRGGHVRRLRLMHQLDPEATRETVKRALDEGSKEVRVAAIECLGGTPEDLTHLMEHATSKNKEVRGAAIRALAKCDEQAAIEALQNALTGRDLELAAHPISQNRNPKLLKFVLDQCREAISDLLDDTGKRKKTPAKKDDAEAKKRAERVLWLLNCLDGRDDALTQAFLQECFGRQAEIAQVKGDPGGQDILHRLAEIMARGPLDSRRALIAAHASLPPEQLTIAFISAINICPAAEVFDTFSPYLTAATGGKKKKNDPSQSRHDVIAETLTESWVWHQYRTSDEEGEERASLYERLDPRWLDLAVRLKQMPLVQVLARPGHEASTALVGQAFQEQLAKSKDPYDLAHLLETMIRVQHPDAIDATLAAITKGAKTSRASWGLFWILRQIRNLPQEAVPRLEALLPSLPEKIVDDMLDQIADLKSQVSDG